MARFNSMIKISLFSLAFSHLLVAADQSNMIRFEQPKGHSTFDKFNQSLACYVSDALVGTHEGQCRQASRWQFDAFKLPELGQQQLTQTVDFRTNTVDQEKLREWWGVWSYALRENQLQNQMIASDLTTFSKNTAFKSWQSEVVAPSLIKRKTRVIYRSPETFGRAISVAQTLDTDAPDLTARVIETEVAIERNDQSGNADFYSYDAAGHLATTSQFPTGEKPAPAFCLGCHFAQSSGTFTRAN